jgi:hypothetical protein
MIRRLVAVIALTAIFAFSPQQVVRADPHAATGTSLAMFRTEAAAQAHCPRDVIVWLNVPSGIYHEKGMRWYGRTKYGAYVCRKEANAAGDRDTRNRQ